VSSNDDAAQRRTGARGDASTPSSTCCSAERPPSKQVMLQVRFAEVNRNALQQSGLSLFSTRSDATGRITTQQFAGPDFDRQGDIDLLQFSDFLNVFLFSREQGIGGVLKPLQSRGFLQSPPNQTSSPTTARRPAFLAGGEIPIPIVTGLGQTSVLPSRNSASA
jgi:pilus assembly protein CpaC